MAEPAKSPKKRCFVVGPIGKPESDVRIHADWFFDGIVLPLFKSREDLKDFMVFRADKITAPGMIDAQIIGHLLDDELVIADLSRTNPNAFYEIGIRHMIEKPIIHMHEDGGDIPFDVSLYRSIPFLRTTPICLKKAQDDLSEAITAVIEPQYECDNPVIRARGRLRVEQTASPEQRVLLDQLQAMQQRLSDVETRLLPTTKPDGGKDQRFVSEALTVQHKLGAGGRMLAQKVRDLLGMRAGPCHMGGTLTTFDVDTSGLSIDDISVIEDELLKIQGVTEVALMPF